MDTVEVAVRGAQGKSGFDDKAKISRFSPDRGERLSLSKVLGDGLPKILHRPFEKRDSRHMISTLYCEKRDFELCVRWNG